MEGKNHRKLRILVAPLDWGLGHATRCIPIIRHLLDAGVDVWLAGEGAQQKLLMQEFPEVPFLPLEGYRIQYSRTRAGLFWKILVQMPHLVSTIKKENKWLDSVITQHEIDAVISDNRFGLYTKKVPCIFITHQLYIKTTLGKWVNEWLQKWNYSYINRFSACWVPDYKNNNGLAGELSHSEKKPAVPLHYVGLLSRLQQLPIAEKQNHVFISLSGPEPQRTLLEEKIISQIAHYTGTATIVRGLPNESRLIPSTNDIRFYNHLSAKEYNEEIQKAEYVMSRSGYSTVMDIVCLHKKSILIPTPGQTEQEYLGEYLMHKRIAYSISQNNFSFKNALEKAKQVNYEIELNINNDLKKQVDLFVQSLMKSFNLPRP